MCHDLPLLARHRLCLRSAAVGVLAAAAGVLADAAEGRRAFYRPGEASAHVLWPAATGPSPLGPCWDRSCTLNTEKIERVNFRARHSVTVFDRGKRGI